MTSIWRSQQNDKKNTGSQANGNRESVDDNDTDERTNLLSHRAQDGYLSPDDPAVSPYNLWSICFLRYFSIIFAILTAIWWVLILVSTFVTPPGMYSRGSGFYSFSFSSSTLGLLVVILLFFSKPSKAAQVTCLIQVVIFLFDLIIILSVQNIRDEEGWIGITTLVWALLMSIWTIFTDRLVTWGRHKEEERLTGRSETRRTLSEWLAVFASNLVLIIIAAVAFLLACTLILRSRDSTLRAPGTRYYVDGNKYKIHLFCSPKLSGSQVTKSPVVLFEAGKEAFGNSMIQIAENAIANGSIDRYCYSDRPGIAWSDNAPSPFSAGAAANALSEALASAGETGPWILVSAGIGSIYSRVFSSRHGSDIKGFMMIDPLHEDLLGYIGSPSNSLLLWIRGVISPLGLDQIPAAIRNQSREGRVYGRSAHRGSKFIKAKLQESLVAETTTKSEVNSATFLQDENVPLVLISSGINVKRSAEWKEKQQKISHLTNNLISWDIVDGAPSEVWNTKSGREVIEKRLKAFIDA